MKMIYQKDRTERPIGKTKIGGVEFGYKLIEDGAEMPDGWRSHADIVNGEEVVELTDAEKNTAALKEAKAAMEKECLEATDVNLDSRKTLENMQKDYDDAVATKELAEEEEAAKANEEQGKEF